MTLWRVALLLAALLTALPVAAGPPAFADPVQLPPDRGAFDYQLGGAYPLATPAVIVRDATATPMPGAYNVCYVNGFQTQPGDGDEWLQQRGAAVLRDADGAPVTDPDWPDEYVLDPSTSGQRTIILDALGPLVADCAARGFDAVEFDNLDTFTRFPAISEAGAVDLARAYLSRAHELGLAAGQKNAAEHTTTFHALGFDFAVAEECTAFGECSAYTDEYGPHVMQVEYTDNLAESFAGVCAAPDRAPLTILRDRELRPAGARGHVREQCP